jgi:hypothetical protein
MPASQIPPSRVGTSYAATLVNQPDSRHVLRWDPHSRGAAGKPGENLMSRRKTWAGLRRGYSLTGPCKLRINWVAAGVSAIEHLPFELRASTARILNAYVPEPLIRAYLPVPLVSL